MSGHSTGLLVVVTIVIATIAPPLWMIALSNAGISIIPDSMMSEGYLASRDVTDIQNGQGRTIYKNAKYSKQRTYTGSLIFNSPHWEFGMVRKAPSVRPFTANEKSALRNHVAILCEVSALVTRYCIFSHFVIPSGH